MAALNPSLAVKHGDEQFIDPESHPALAERHPQAAALPLPIPDIRFEQSYLRSISKYVDSHAEEDTHESSLAEQAALVQTARSAELVHVWRDIQWGTIIWLGFRDQVIYQYFQGTALSLLSLVILPYGKSLVGRMFGISSSANARRRTEGNGVGVLRQWFRGLTGGFSTGR
ncbi:hypothetical protein AURDEDRAFT_110206 [Auricularia subglabra TFB-10046 SS5]|nr:hypothetical protein AURDEDRAFT_110206 [Auricularia subglabra TFB-10046 SS5]